MSTPVKVVVLSVALASLSGHLLADDYADGVAALGQKEYAKAILLLTKAIEQKPNDADVFVARGTAHRSLNELDEALADYDEAIRIDPKNVSAYINRGRAWADKGEFDKALADCDEAIRLGPENPAAYIGRASVWNSMLELDRALADYDKLIRLEPKNPEAYILRGGTWERLHTFDKSLADYDEAIRLDPKSVDAHRSRAWIRATCPDETYRDGEKAVVDSTKACKLTNWKDPFVLGTLAAAYAEAGQFDKAVEWQKKAIELARDYDKEFLGTFLELYKRGEPYRAIPVPIPVSSFP
jgi:tetratricopeptide (TPR) repeat protein